MSAPCAPAKIVAPGLELDAVEFAGEQCLVRGGAVLQWHDLDLQPVSRSKVMLTNHQHEPGIAFRLSMTPCRQGLRSCAPACAPNRARTSTMAIPRASIMAASRRLLRSNANERSAFPFHAIDAWIAAKSGSIKVETHSWHFTKSSCSIAAQNNTPGLALNWIRGGEGATRQERYIQLFFGVANRQVFDDFNVGRAGKLGELLTLIISSLVHPNGSASIERRSCQIDRPFCRVSRRECRVFARFRRPGGAGRFRKEQQAPET